jgi:hypothetical protein
MLTFDPEKIKAVGEKKADGIFLSIEYSFSASSVCASSSTVHEMREDIPRIGGFDTEIIDKETFKLINNF